MCRTTLFEKPAITYSVPGPHVVAAMGTLSDELLRRVPLAGAQVGEGGGDGAVPGSASPERAVEGSGNDGAIPGIDSPARAVEANADDGVLSLIDPSQDATEDEGQAAALLLRLRTVDQALMLAQVLQLKNYRCLARLSELEREPVTEEGAGEIFRIGNQVAGYERRLVGVREWFGRRGLGERYHI